jgi:pyruvate/2-oxoglutarate dehydrogenase complex dihydrolipoamide dehydrogenase (E3) component
LILGGGSAGYAAARVAGQMGATVGLVERGPVGGLCILEGCMPSKALLRSGDVLHLLRTAGQLGVDAPAARADFGRVMERKRRLVDAFAASRRDEIETAAGVELLLGEVRLTGRHEVSLRTTDEAGRPVPGTPERAISGRTIVLATGSTPVIPSIDGLADAGYITTDEALGLEAPPASMIVLGAGAVALELGQFYARMGTQVTLLERSRRVLSDEDAEMGETLAGYLRDEGLSLQTSVGVRTCRRRPDGRCSVAGEVDGRAQEFVGDVLLVATGRRAATSGLDVAAAGVRLDEDGALIAVDETMRTSNPDIYAAGDVASRLQATHLAVLQGEVAGFNAARALGLGGGNGVTAAADAFLPPAVRRLGGVAQTGPNGFLRMDDTVVPQVLFTDPTFARVGINEREAHRSGLSYASARYDYADHGMAMNMGQTRGFVKMLGAPDGGRLLGVQILGHQADTLIHEACVAMAFGASAAQLARIPHYHPTLSEILAAAAEALAGAGRGRPADRGTG